MASSVAWRLSASGDNATVQSAAEPTIVEPMRSPTVYCGPMWGGKTEALISTLVRARIQEISTIAFNPAKNDRYGTSDIRAHSGASFPAISVQSGTEILEHVRREKPTLVGIDEFFMIEGALDAVRTLRLHGTLLVIATLDMDSEGHAWESVGPLLGLAEDVVKCPAVCAHCKADAYLTFRKGIAPTDRVLVGTDDFYEPRCWTCFVDGQAAKTAQGGAGSLFGHRS